VTVAERLARMIEICFDGSVPKFSKAIGWKRTTAYKYLKGEREPGRESLQGMLDAGINPGWILGGHDPMFAWNEAGQDLELRVREKMGVKSGGKPGIVSELLQSYGAPEAPSRRATIYLNPASAGSGQPADGYVDAEVDIAAYILPKAEMFLVPARGDSMLFDSIQSGDMLVIDPTIEPRSGMIVLAIVGGEIYVKRYEVENGHVMLYSSGGPMLLDEGTSIEIRGVVKRVIHDV